MDSNSFHKKTLSTILIIAAFGVYLFFTNSGQTPELGNQDSSDSNPELEVAELDVVGNLAPADLPQSENPNLKSEKELEDILKRF